MDIFTQMGIKKFKPTEEDLERIKTLKCLEDQLKAKREEERAKEEAKKAGVSLETIINKVTDEEFAW